MPEETRFLKFSLKEVIAGLKMFSHLGDYKLPKQDVKGAVEHIGPEGHVMEFSFHETDYKVSVKSSFTAAALIRFCKELSIPIPKNEEKSIAVVGDSVMLKIGSEKANFANTTEGKKLGKGLKDVKKSLNSAVEETLL